MLESNDLSKNRPALFGRAGTAEKAQAAEADQPSGGLSWREIQKENEPDVAPMESFVRSHRNGHFLQMPRWAGVKALWDWRGILVYRDKELSGAVSILIRPLPFGFSLFYAPRGPVCDRSDKRVWDALMAAIKELAKRHKAVLLYMDPDEPDGSRCRDILLGLGFRERSDDGFGNIQPQYVFRLALAGKSEEAVYGDFTPKTRYNIGLAQRKGVTIREYSGAEALPAPALDAFSGLMAVTGDRDHFYVRDAHYFESLLHELREDARLFLAYYQDQPIAGTIEVFCGRKAWYLYGASSNVHRNAMPNYLLQWTMIQRAMERNCTVYDFRGVPGNPSEADPLFGLYRFKKGCSGTYTKFTGLFTFAFRPKLAAAVQAAVKRRRRLVPRTRITPPGTTGSGLRCP